MRNHDGFDGFRLNDKRFSVFPYEQEFLLMEGFQVFVLEVQDEFVIKNKHRDLQRYDGKELTVIYLQSAA